VVKSVKETDASLVQTLSSYGVDATHLNALDISVSTQSGFMYFLVTFLPIILPILLVIFFFWMLTRQSKGAGMQAFTFGTIQSAYH